MRMSRSVWGSPLGKVVVASTSGVSSLGKARTMSTVGGSALGSWSTRVLRPLSCVRTGSSPVQWRLRGSLVKAVRWVPLAACSGGWH